MDKEKTEHEKQLELHTQQQEMIRLEMEAESPLIGDLFDLAFLLDEFINN